MNVFGTVRRVVGRLPLMHEEEDEEEEDEPNLCRKTIMQERKIFLNSTSSVDDMERALENIGHASYTGGLECNDIVSELIPNILKIIGDKKCSTSLRLQCLRSLTVICHYNKPAIDKVWKAVKFWQIIPEIISEFETPLISRWACLLTTTMTAHSMAFLKDIDRIPNLVQSLQAAAQFDHDWQGFGCDHAKKMLTLTGRLSVAAFQQSIATTPEDQ